MKRRQVMRGLMAASVLSAGPLPALAAHGPMTLLAAGPAGERIGRWGTALALAMQPAMPGNPTIVVQRLGGLDGVTGANRLDTLVVPDGRTAAIIPGDALIAWLTGDPRVHFDPTRWIPVMAGARSGVLVVRLPAGAPATVSTLRMMPPLRLAADEPQSSDLAVLLALARLGLRCAPIFGVRDTAAKTQAFLTGEADAVFLCGEGVAEDIAPLTTAGGVPIFDLGMLDAAGLAVPDPQFPTLPDAVSLGAGTSDFLDAAYRAAAAAARLDFMMVLPRLTDSAAVAQWRQAAKAAMQSPAVTAAAAASAVLLQDAPTTGAGLDRLRLVAMDQSGLQAFLKQSFGWQPG
ncbi:MAG: hypothetical protein B7Z81_02780 [Acidocella sp. 20-61-6]|nr:MAG: hypothetical protein B7Z81_02780 [Acidocella sp. 20-61-6]